VVDEEHAIDATRITIRRTTDTVVRRLPAVERSAARSFATIPELSWIVDDDVLDEAQHRRYVAASRHRPPSSRSNPAVVPSLSPPARLSARHVGVRSRPWVGIVTSASCAAR
jgi:hypothetical protein